MPRKYLLVGLGNVGAEYAGTRHNVGFDVVDVLATRHEAIYRPERYAFHASFRLKGRIVHLIKPTTYMNRSGLAVAYWMRRHNIEPENLLVILDDVSLPLCRIRLRKKGGSAGHNGLQNVMELLGTDHFPRLRIGIGNHYPRGRQVDYVLGMWTPEEQEKLEKILPVAADATESFVLEGIQTAMNRYNSGEIC